MTTTVTTEAPALPFRLGVTLHSFSNEYRSLVWSFEDLMEITAVLGGGVEIVGPSHHRDFPHVPDEFVAAFRSSVERHGLTPTSYGSYADPFMLPDRDLNHDELVEYTIPQLVGAKRLGFPIVRLQHFTAEVIEALLPWAARLDLILAWELHVPLMIESERTQYLISLVQKYSTPHLGLIPDAGIFARSVSRRHIRQGLEAGIPAELVDRAVAAWNDNLSLEEAYEIVGNPPADSGLTAWVGMIWDNFGHSEPAALASIMPHVVHFHGKFFHIDDGDEPNLRYADVVAELVRSGYSGWISSEYEGDAEDSFAEVAAHQAMIRRYAAAALTPSS